MADIIQRNAAMEPNEKFMMKNKQQRPILIEGLESRLQCDASQLTETILSSTLAASVSDQSVLRGAVAIQVTNNSGIEQKFAGQVGVYVADETLSIPGGAFTILRSEHAGISLASGATKVFKVPVAVAPGKLPDGSYTLFGVVTDSSNLSSQSSAGPTLLMRPPIVALSETEKFTKLPASAFLNTVFNAVDRVTITNNGSDPFRGTLDVALLASPEGVVTGSTTVTSLVRKLVIPAGRSAIVAFRVRSVANVPAGTYQMIAGVTQPNGTVTSSSATAAPTFSVMALITTPEFVDTISSVTETYAVDSSDISAQHVTQLQLQMSIQNNGTTSIGSDQYTLFASTKPTFDSSAIQEATLPLTQDIYSGEDKSFQIDIGVPDNGPDNGTVVNYYIFVQVKDTAGDVTTATYPTQIAFAGPT